MALRKRRRPTGKFGGEDILAEQALRSLEGRKFGGKGSSRSKLFRSVNPKRIRPKKLRSRKVKVSYKGRNSRVVRPEADDYGWDDRPQQAAQEWPYTGRMRMDDKANKRALKKKKKEEERLKKLSVKGEMRKLMRKRPANKGVKAFKEKLRRMRRRLK